MQLKYTLIFSLLHNLDRKITMNHEEVLSTLTNVNAELSAQKDIVAKISSETSSLLDKIDALAAAAAAAAAADPAIADALVALTDNVATLKSALVATDEKVVDA